MTDEHDWDVGDYGWEGAEIRAPNEVDYVDDVRLKVSNLKPDTEVTIRARMPLANGIWSSWATFESDKMGRVTLASQAPIEGTYKGVDPTGLFWSMTQESKQQMASQDDHVTSTVVDITVEMFGKVVGETEIERVIADDVESEMVREDGLVAEFHEPSGDGPHPAVVVLGGSEGGIPSSTFSIQLASEGYSVLSLAYFGMGSLPSSLEEVPLEYFQSAIKWLEDHEGVSGPPFGLVGFSRGGELGLMLAARNSEFHPVIGYAPSGLRYRGVPNGMGWADGAWSEDGETLPYVPHRFYPGYVLQIFWHLFRRKPLGLAPAYRRGLEKSSEQAISEAEIEVENIAGDVLLITGGDDRIWPAKELTDIATDRLERNDFEHDFEHLHYEDAGHQMGLPNSPHGDTSGDGFLPGLPLAFGGTPKANVNAGKEAWEAMTETLSETLDQQVVEQVE